MSLVSQIDNVRTCERGRVCGLFPWDPPWAFARAPDKNWGVDKSADLVNVVGSDLSLANCKTEANKMLGKAAGAPF